MTNTIATKVAFINALRNREIFSIKSYDAYEENSIYAICYDDISNNIIKIPVYKTSSSKKLETILYDIVSCYRNNSNGVYWFC